MQRRNVMLCLLFSVGFFSSRSGAAVLDQVYDPPSDLAAVINDGFPYIAQVVTAGVQGHLSRADLSVHSATNTFADWLVTVNAVHSGVPTSTILASQLVPVNLSSSLEVDFATPAFFNAGDSFALVISASGQPIHQTAGVWSGSFDHPYPAGGLGFESLDDANFSPISTVHPGSAVAFDTYVTVPEPTSMGILASLGCAMLAGRRKR